MYIDEETVRLLSIISSIYSVIMVSVFVYFFIILPVSMKTINDKKDGKDLWLDIQWKT